MKCFSCGTEVHSENRCPGCGRDLTTYRKIINASNRAYNDGLARAGARDLTGAAQSLNLSLRYNKHNTDARNLLGLVYYECGDMVHALNEWVVSRSLQPEDNPADRYMEAVTRNGAGMKSYATATQKYNQSLSLCRHGSLDLAKLQLRRVVKKRGGNSLIQAYQLLALILISEERYEEAYSVLEDATSIDKTNPLTLRYQKLISPYVFGKDLSGKQQKKKKNETIDFFDGNDNIILPRSNILDSMDNTRSGIINILMGGAVGVLASVFLIFPTLRQNANTEAQSALVTANEKAMSTESNVNNLNKQVKKLKKRLENYEGKSDIKGSYEGVVEAQRDINSDDIDAAGEALADVNKDLLNKHGKAAYDEINEIVAQKQLEDNYKAGANEFHYSNYEDAIPLLQGVVDVQPEIDDGNGLYFLAQCYDYTGQDDKAKEYYNRFLDSHGGTRRGREASRALREIEREEQQNNNDE